MRMMMKLQFDTAAGSRAIADGSLPELLRDTMTRLQPEAAYFGPDDGVRTSFIVFDLEDPSQLPSISEPLFSKLNASIKLFPVMNQEDLQKGLQQLASS